MKSSRFHAAKTAARPAVAVILFWTGSHRLAITASALREIRQDGGWTPEELGCKRVVSAAALFGTRPNGEARLLVLRRGGVAVRVDRVDRLIEIAGVRPLPRMFRGAERSWYCGLAVVAGEVIPVINPEAFLRQGQEGLAA